MNVIRNCIALAVKELKIIFKDRGQLVVLFGLPMLFGLVFAGPYVASQGTVSTSGEAKLRIKTYIVNEDQGPIGAQVVEVLETIEPLDTFILRSVDLADRNVAKGEAPAAIIIPADFSANIETNQPSIIKLIKDPSRQPEARAVAGILNEVLTEVSVRAEIEYGIWAVYAKTGVLNSAEPEMVRAAQAQTMGTIWTAVQEIRQNPAIDVQIENQTGKDIVISISGFLFGAYMSMFATMFAFFLVGFMAKSILSEKEGGSFRRLLAAPLHRGTIIVGKILAFMVVVFLQMCVLFGISSLFFGMPLGNSVLGLITLTLALSLTATSLGMLVGSLAQTSKQAENIGTVLGFLLLLASGVTSASIGTDGNVGYVNFPEEGFLYYISRLTPHAHANDGFYQLIFEGANLVDIYPNILILLGFAVIFFLVAIWRFKFD